MKIFIEKNLNFIFIFTAAVKRTWKGKHHENIDKVWKSWAEIVFSAKNSDKIVQIDFCWVVKPKTPQKNGFRQVKLILTFVLGKHLLVQNFCHFGQFIRLIHLLYSFKQRFCCLLSPPPFLYCVFKKNGSEKLASPARFELQQFRDSTVCHFDYVLCVYGLCFERLHVLFCWCRCFITLPFSSFNGIEFHKLLEEIT